MSSVYQAEPKYTGDGGNAQRIFIKDAQVGWKNILDDLNRHLSNGASQYAYLESILNRLGGQARRLLDLYLAKWDWLNEDNIYYEEAITREASRAVWRTYYKAKAVHDLRQVQVAVMTRPPVRPDQLDDPIPEPNDLEEFLLIIQSAFQAASAVFLEDLKSFHAVPRESLVKMADRFDEVASPLFLSGLMTSRGLALHLRSHIPVHIRRVTLNAMAREDEKRFNEGEPLIDKDELMVMAQKKEAFLLEFESEMRAAGLVTDPRATEASYALHTAGPRVHRPVEDRPNQGGREMRDRLGTRPDPPMGETRECHVCKKVGHIAKFCPNATVTPPLSRATTTRPDNLAAHKTSGHICESCKKPGHTSAQCWSAHPELVPEALLKKRQAAMSATLRKRRRTTDYTSPGYAFQGMALTYKRPLPAMVQRRSTRPPQPTEAAREAAAQRSDRHVRFSPSATQWRRIPPVEKELNSDLLTTPVLTENERPGNQEKYPYTAQLPQSFPHGLPTSSLEPGTTDQQYPPSSLFPEPPLGDGEIMLMETPLQSVAQLRHASANLQQLVGELAASLWDKATDQERYFPVVNTPSTITEPVPVVAAAERANVHYTPAFLDNTKGVLDVEGYVPKETILDTGAAKVMLSKTFAAAMNINVRTLSQGVDFVTASGAVEKPLGVTKNKVRFTLSRGTSQMCTIEVEATIVDTTAYDVLLGMEFVAAMCGAYDSYTEMFTYRWHDATGLLNSHSISAPCHVSSRPLIAYACFGGLICTPTELQDVQATDDDYIPEDDDDYGFHSSPLQLAATELSRMEQVCAMVETVRAHKEVRGHDQERRENAAARLAAVTPLSLRPLQPTSKWLGNEVMGATPINTATRMLTQQSTRDGLHVLELFGGVGLGVLRTALAAGYTVRCYTYVDRDVTSRRIAAAVLHKLQLQYPQQLPDAAIKAFDKRLPQTVSLCSNLFLSNLVTRHGPVDLLGGSWECQSVSRAGHQTGAMDPRFQFFYDLVRIINFFQREQTSAMIYILENTYPGEMCTAAVRKAGELVQAFVGAPVLLDAAHMGAAAHRVRLFWTNMLQPAVLQTAMPTLLLPSPPLKTILKPYHVPTTPGHTDSPPFAMHNQKGGVRLVMPTIVSYLESNAFRRKDNGAPGEGQLFNITTKLWEEPDAEEKELLLGYQRGETATPGITEDQRAIRLGRALDGNTMRWLGAFLHASQA